MDILRNIEKKILNIANNNSNSTSEINNLKKDIKQYLDFFDKREELKREKKNIYDELYDNKRKAYQISYENYLLEKKELMKDVIKERTKGAIRKYLECKYEDEEALANIPNIYTYENIRLNNVVPASLKPVPPKEPRKNPKDIKERKVIKAPKPPTVPNKVPKPVQPSKPTVIEPMVPKPPTILSEPTVIEPTVIEPMVPKPPTKPKKLPKMLNKPKLPPTEPKEISVVHQKPLNKLPNLNKEVKECPEGEEINPKTGKCVKKCKEGEIRNPVTGRCNKIKESKPAKAVKAAKAAKLANAETNS